MKLSDVRLDTSPLDRGRVRLSAMLSYATRGRDAEQLWFDVDELLAGQLSQGGNPWLAALLPLAVTLGEPLELPRPVDAMLREGAEGMMSVWSTWFDGQYQPIAIHSDVAPRTDPDSAGRTAVFFSAGVDSFHSLLRHEPGGTAHDRFRIDDLLTIWGFDVPTKSPDAFRSLHANIQRVAEATGKTSVTIATNLRESGWRDANWGKIAQGSGLAAVALALEGRYRRVLIPSSIPFRSSRQWGTHPLVDPLLSTSRTDIRNDGALMRRQGKLRSLVASDLAMNNLHVCWIGQSATNCGRCEKCLRTLTGLEMLGALDRATTFPPGAWSLAALANLELRQDLDRHTMVRLETAATERGRRDIAQAVRRAIRRYDTKRRLVRLARALGLR